MALAGDLSLRTMHSKTIDGLFPLPIASRLQTQIDHLESRQHGSISIPKRGSVMIRWLEYDLVAFAVLVFGIAAVQFLAIIL